jgi:Response regulator containing a CheY-like receiver domain and an HTH DNA-binding domain
MRVLIADDQPEVRSAIKILFEHEVGFEIVGEADNVGTLQKKLKECQPDMVLLDWELFDFKNTGMIPLLHYQYPGLIIIALSGRPESAKAAISAGVDAFISKGENSDRLLETISRLGLV